jgi:hypothetical protein
MGLLRNSFALLCCIVVVAVIIAVIGIARSRNRPK